MGIIYKVTFPNNKIYVGYTSKSLEKRKKEHYMSVKYNSNYIFHKALNKYNEQDIKWEVIEQSEDEYYMLNIAESYWINELNSHFNKNGYNMTYGGQKGSNVEWYKSLSDEQKNQYKEVLKENLKKANDALCKEHILNGWKNNERKLKAKTRCEDMWKDIEKKEYISKKISKTKKEKFALGLYDYKNQAYNASIHARTVIKGSKWYNDGIKNYRLKPDNILTINLKIGRIK